MGKIPGPHSVVWRFVAGLPLDGYYRTDARFWHRGVRLIAPIAARRWSYLPGWQRATVRLGFVIGLPALAWQALTHPTRTILGAAGITLLAALYGGWRLRQAFRDHRVTRTYVKPLHAVLAPVLGLPPDTRAGDYITVPASFRTREDTPVRIALPRSFNPVKGSKELLSGAVLPKLGLNEDNTDVIFHLVGNPVMVCKMAPQPPDRVPWAEHVEFMRALEPGQVFVGLGARAKPYTRDFRPGDVVHGGFNVQTGFGKSAAAMGWIAQVLGNDPDAQATYIDPKHSALPMALVGVPGYTLANNPDDVEEMWTAIELFEEEFDRRMKARNADPTLEFPLMWLVLDELSEFADITSEKWDEIREKGSKKTAPIWRSIARILRMGREFGCRVIVFTQRLDSRSTGNIGLRDLFGWRGLAGYRRNHWMMLIGTTPIPRSVHHIGRWIYSDGSKELWVQNVYGAPKELRDYALTGRRPVDTHRGHTPLTRSVPAKTAVNVQWDIIGLQAAADYLQIPVSTFRKRRQRAEGIDGEGVVGRSPAWMRTDLDKFDGRVIQ